MRRMSLPRDDARTATSTEPPADEPAAGGPSVPLPPNPDDKREPAAPEGGVPADRPDPTRYGDWEINGRCIDF